MAFSKKKNPKVIDIAVTHPWHPGEQFVFTFPKHLPQSALEAEKSFLGLKDTERAEEYRKSLINAVAEMLEKEPEGFDDFPAGTVSGSLADRVRSYFDDDAQPELEAIIVSAWKAYKVAALPSTFLRSA